MRRAPVRYAANHAFANGTRVGENVLPFVE